MSARGHWLLGHIPAIRSDPLGLLDACHAPAAQLWLGRRAWLLLEPADVAHVLQSNGGYSKGRAFRFGKRLYGNSLLVSEGAEHQSQAKLIGGLFFRHAARSFLDPAPAIADQLARRWQANQSVDLWSAMLDLTLALSSQAIFGEDWLPAWLPGGSTEAEGILHAFDTAMGHVAAQNFSLLPCPDWLPFPAVRRYHRAIATLDRAFERSVARRLRGEAHNGLLAHFLQARDEAGQPLPASQIRDQALVLLLGGYESSATALCWMLLLLGQHDAVRKRLINEVRDVVGNRLPAPDDVRNLPCTARVISESLRLYPSPWLIPRTATTEDVLPSGLRLSSGTLVFLSPYRTQRDDRFFHEPLRFDPDRFAAAPSWPEGAYFPFGAGPRHCIGESIARAQMALILATLCPRWQVRIETDQLPAPCPLLTLRPPIPLWVRVHPERSSHGREAGNPLD